MRRLRFVFAVVLLSLFPLAALAAGKTPAPGDDAQNAGLIEGRVTGVDYQRGTLAVATSGGPVTVATMPSTSVQADSPGYHAITDVAKGANVQIFTSRIAGKLVAQIIRLVKR